jgi:hypothetical protein
MAMAMESACPLSAPRVATVEAREDAWHVICPQCLRFTLDPYLFDLFGRTSAWRRPGPASSPAVV